MGQEEAKRAGAENSPAFQQPLTINMNPCLEGFRTQLGFLFAHIDYSLSNGPLKDIRFQSPLVIWDGVDRPGERKLVSLVPTGVDVHKISRANIVLPYREEQPNISRVHKPIKLTTDPDRAEDEIFIGSAHDFLNFFQSACKAIEDCFTPDQITTAAIRSQNELAGDAAKLKRQMHTRNLQDYQIKLYGTFLAELSNLRYSAY